MPLSVSPHRVDQLLPDLGREHRPKPVPPEPNRLVADVDPALRQQVLDVAQGQRLPDVHHHHRITSGDESK